MNRVSVAIIALLLLSACGRGPEPAVADPDLAAGQTIAQEECSGCHAVDGSGMTEKIPNLAGQPEDYLVDAMHAYADGRRHHAALQDLISGLSPAQVRAIAAWYASLPPLPPATAPSGGDSSYREGMEVASLCTECHGEQGFSTTPGVPSLAGQQPAYLIVATQEYADGSRGHAGKEEMLEGLEQVDIEKMAMYFAAQAPQLREPPQFGNPAAGEALSAPCGECHGSRGVSHDPLIPNLAGQEPAYLVNAIKAYRDRERSHEDMVAEISDGEIADLAAFYSAQPAGSLTDLEEDLDSVVAKCNRCHGRAEGESSLAVPSLNGQKRDYLVRVMKQYRDDDRGSSMMHKMSSGYSDELIQQLADWYAGQPHR